MNYRVLEKDRVNLNAKNTEDAAFANLTSVNLNFQHCKITFSFTDDGGLF